MGDIYAPKSINDILPYEVISYSFTLVDPCNPKNTNLPSTLSLVCKTWRRVALDTPGVWTSIRIQVRKKPLTKDTVDASKEWFQRSRQLGCHLYLEFPLRFREETLDSIVSELVQPIAPRLETLSLCVPAPFLGDLANITPFRFPRLHSFTLRFPRDDHSRLIPFESLPSFCQSTSLRKLDLSHAAAVGIIQQDPATSFAWSKLTHLKLNERALSPLDSVTIFCLSTNLVECELTIAGWPQYALNPAPGNLVTSTPSGNPYHPPCIHPHLRVLKLEFSSGAVSPFFARLSLPKLEDFRLSAQAVLSPEQVHEALVDLAARHPIEGLKRFEVQGIPCPVNTMVEFLKKNEELETIKLDACQLCDEEFLEKLIIVPNTPEASTPSPANFLSPSFQHSTSLVPKLKNLWLKGARPASDRVDMWLARPSPYKFKVVKGRTIMKRHATRLEQAIGSFVKSRSPGVEGALKKFVMDNERVEDERILKELDKLKGQGMVLEVNGMEKPIPVSSYGYYHRSAVSDEAKDWVA
ncbi:hypothetical protein BDN72DRAFT_848405 [Pluteus cervinus]|uniref:Uncharacterized protein n=1 Tax=Pluteus cervinus TaxID=181527 RepID=A0ACD3A9X6_9AGAR|nr:hypothetical protein BDN72DRAFT_848405 [Pluteus cervinus]